MRSILASVLLCAACQPYAGPAVTAAAPAPAGPPPCASRTVPLLVGGQPQQAVVEACPQPDGSWRITQTTPGLPVQVYEVPAPDSSAYPYFYPSPADYADSDFFPYWDGSPWFFGIAPAVVVAQRFHHFHHGFAHGGRFGFGHGFAGAHAGGRR